MDANSFCTLPGLLIAVGIVTIVCVLHHVGLFRKVKVRVGKPALRNALIAYKSHTGPYEKCGPFFKEAYELCPQLDCIGIYCDDPNVVAASELRYAVGLVLSEGDNKPKENLVDLVTSRGFRVLELPAVDQAVITDFPFVSWCVWLAPWKVYPALSRFVVEHKLNAHPFIELYVGDKIHYIAPVKKQREFYVPEFEYKELSNM